MAPHDQSNCDRRHVLGGTFGLFLPSLAHAQSSSQTAPSPQEAVTVRGQTPSLTLQTWVDLYGRPTAQVMLNGQGPFRFVVDTGSNTTVISTRVARLLALPVLPARIVHGVTGSMSAQFGRLRRVETGRSSNENLAVAILDAPAFEELDGILGMDMFANRRIRFNFARKTVDFEQAARRTQRLPIRANVRLRQGLLLEAEGRIGNMRARCVLDTGCDTSIINTTLFNALRSPAALRRRNAVPPRIVGVTNQELRGVWAALPEVNLIGLKIRQLTVAAADVPVFDLWGLSQAPAMLVGMDILSQVETLVIDYRRREVEVKMLANLISGVGAFARG
jgi:Aspartyl protease